MPKWTGSRMDNLHLEDPADALRYLAFRTGRRDVARVRTLSGTLAVWWRIERGETRVNTLELAREGARVTDEEAQLVALRGLRSIGWEVAGERQRIDERTVRLRIRPQTEEFPNRRIG